MTFAGEMKQYQNMTLQSFQRKQFYAYREPQVHLTQNYFSKILTAKKVKHDHNTYPEYGCLAGSTEFGEYLLRLLVCKEVLAEQPPPETARNQNTVYLTLGPKYLQVLSGQLGIKCTIKNKNC